MANAPKNLWIVIVLVAAGVALFAFSLTHTPKPGQEVVLQDVSKQTAMTAAAQQASSAAAKPADPVSSPAIVTSPENGHETGFAIQVYSFQDQGRAEKALTNLKSSGYNAYMEVSDLGEKGTWYRVRIGGIANANEAQGMLDQIRKNYQSGIIVKPSKI